jgi:hypothetical protein
MREKELQEAIVGCAGYLNWSVYHTYDSRRSAPGFPDLVLIRPPRMIVAELKTEKGRLSDWQRIWLDMFERVPVVEVYVWRPVDWHAGTIDEVLR